ncbi:hypothetical protein [Paraburkholderia megapolitana]|uniref:Uncharacterized protein n=1 Tax=Paraburkholderia megapolitana TaxID=420953 RepID=A0A1I3MMJ1_9BURK|nr:hypothetical protein [Paraburkholderia megapolitana]QDQ84068.1 hypothetical protein FNZ07_23370 [Paraburkholderia megapolitana]SFI98193.1 hypothetical protein SAMN05192543_10534 [Paraburkholderia megapolitana]
MTYQRINYVYSRAWNTVFISLLAYAFISTATFPDYFNGLSAKLAWLCVGMDLGRSHPWVTFVGLPWQATLDLLGAASGAFLLLSLIWIWLIAMTLRESAGPDGVFGRSVYLRQARYRQAPAFGSSNGGAGGRLLACSILLGAGGFSFVRSFTWGTPVTVTNSLDLVFQIAAAGLSVLMVAAGLYGLILILKYFFTNGAHDGK